MYRKNDMSSGLRASYPRAILLNELRLLTSPTQPPADHLAAPAAPSNSKKPVPDASISLHHAPAVHLHHTAIRMTDLDERLRALAKVSGDYVPAASTFFQVSSSGPSTLSIRVADVAESNVVRQIAAELGVPSDGFDIDVDSRIRPSTSHILTACNIADARADTSGELAVKIALYVLQRTVLDASVELWDLNATDALSATWLRVGGRADSGVDTESGSAGDASATGMRPTESHDKSTVGPRTEVRVCVRAEHFAVADAAVETLRAALPSDCLCISAVIGESHNLTGPWPPLSHGASIRVKEMSQPATHPEFPRYFKAFVEPTSCTTASAGASMASAGGAAAGVAPSTAVDSIPARYDLHTVHGAVASVKGRMTASAYARVNDRLCVVSAGHELGTDPVACLLDPDTPLTRDFFVNPPACLRAPSFTVANSSDAYPNARRIEAGDPPMKSVFVLVEAHADVSLFTISRETTAEEEDLVPVPVCSRTQMVLESTGPHPVLGLVPHDVARGPLLFACCTAPGQLRTLHNVGLCVKRLPIAMSVTPVAVTSMYTYLCVHDGAASSGPPPAQGDSGGTAFRPSSVSAGGGLAELVAFVCGECVSGGTRGSPLRRYYELTPAALALAQLRAGLVARGDVTAAAALEFLQPRDLVAALAVATLAVPAATP